MQKKEKKACIVGGGLAGLSAALKLAEKGFHIDLVSVTKVKRSHSVCAQGGINAAMNTKGEGDDPLIHAYDTIKGGDFLADQPPVVEMCLAAPMIIEILDRFGCPFNRTPEGRLDFRRFGGTLYNRTAFCGASTGQQLLYALDEQVRRYEAKGFVKKWEHHEFLRAIVDETGQACGIIVQDLFNHALIPMRADVVVVATGGLGLLYRKSTNSTFCTGAANGRLFMQGMEYANGEFIQIHPTAIPGEDKYRLMSESARGEGGRIWVYGDSTKSITKPDGKSIPCGETGKPWYFLEELYPAFGNLVPRDIGAREILRICEMKMGIDGKDEVFLDVSHLSDEKKKKLANILDIYEKFTGQDPKKVPMRIFPAVHYTMGGAWIDWPAAGDPDRFSRFRHMTNIPALFNVGESDFQYHGANRLGANSLLSCIFGGFVTAFEADRFCQTTSPQKASEKLFQAGIFEEETLRKELTSRTGEENLFSLHQELADTLVNEVSVKRCNPGLEKALYTIEEISKRSTNAPILDNSTFSNQTLIFAHQFIAMIEVAKIITLGALLRNESRGSHAKAEFPKRNDEEWLKTTVAQFQKGALPKISYKKVDTRHLDPIARDYSHATRHAVVLKNLPKEMPPPL